MERQGGIRVDGPLGPFRDGVQEALRASGYSPDRATQLVRLMAHLSRWLDERGLGPGDLSTDVARGSSARFALATAGAGLRSRWPPCWPICAPLGPCL